MTRGVDSDLRTDLMLKFEAWYHFFPDFIFPEPYGDPMGGARSLLRYNHVAMNVADW